MSGIHTPEWLKSSAAFMLILSSGCGRVETAANVSPPNASPPDNVKTVDGYRDPMTGLIGTITGNAEQVVLRLERDEQTEREAARWVTPGNRYADYSRRLPLFLLDFGA